MTHASGSLNVTPKDIDFSFLTDRSSGAVRAQFKRYERFKAGIANPMRDREAKRNLAHELYDNFYSSVSGRRRLITGRALMTFGVGSLLGAILPIMMLRLEIPLVVVFAVATFLIDNVRKSNLENKINDDVRAYLYENTELDIHNDDDEKIWDAIYGFKDINKEWVQARRDFYELRDPFKVGVSLSYSFITGLVLTTLSMFPQLDLAVAGLTLIGGLYIHKSRERNVVNEAYTKVFGPLHKL